VSSYRFKASIGGVKFFSKPIKMSRKQMLALLNTLIEDDHRTAGDTIETVQKLDEVWVDV
jgi:hypothetical protein